ncbi:hypothetical protein LQK93_04008 [Terrabacter sp. BE26]
MPPSERPAQKTKALARDATATESTGAGHAPSRFAVLFALNRYGLWDSRAWPAQAARRWQCPRARGLTKRYGTKTAVDDLTFTVKPGVVTGFLGPNGAGKSTTMRMILGLDAPTAGSVLVNGKAYREHASPLAISDMVDGVSLRGSASSRTFRPRCASSRATCAGVGRTRLPDLCGRR